MQFKDNEPKYDKLIKILGLFMISLVVLRLVQLEIFPMISDALAIVMIYFYYLSRGKCMAIFLSINSFFGIVYDCRKIYYSNRIDFYSNLVVIISSYALCVYIFEAFISYVGIVRYSWENFGMPTSNYSSLNNQDYGNINKEEKKSAFTPFSGKGIEVGV